MRVIPDHPAAQVTALAYGPAWDARVERALAKAPGRFRMAVAWLRAPQRRWVRIPAGLLLIGGGLLSILPVLGLWMLPLGLALLGEDSPALKTRLERTARWLEARWHRSKQH